MSMTFEEWVDTQNDRNTFVSSYEVWHARDAEMTAKDDEIATLKAEKERAEAVEVEAIRTLEMLAIEMGGFDHEAECPGEDDLDYCNCSAKPKNLLLNANYWKSKTPGSKIQARLAAGEKLAEYARHRHDCRSKIMERDDTASNDTISIHRSLPCSCGLFAAEI